MSMSNSNRILEIVNPICCGIDVHKESLSACLLYSGEFGEEQCEIREYKTFTGELYKFKEYLISHRCRIVAIESTGVYWQPVYNVLESDVEVMVVNARAIKNVPGRKTDVEDCKWLAGLLRFGLLQGSFIPESHVRSWRNLTRMRSKNRETISDYRKRVQKVFESANIKIDSVVSDLFGVTGNNLMQLLLSGKEIELSDIEKCVRGRLKGKTEELYDSIQGFFSDDHRFELSSLLRIIDALEKEIATIDERLSEMLADHEELIELMKKTPGFSELSARYVISEIGTDMKAFKNSSNLVSWCGLCPGNNESAGKRKSGKTRVRKHYLKKIMIEAAWAAVKTKGSYYKNKFYKLKTRRGAKRAIVAIANRLLKAIYHIIKYRVSYREPGEHYLDSKSKNTKISRLKKQANALGFNLIPV